MDVDNLNKFVTKALVTTVSILGIVVLTYIINIVWINKITL